MMRFLKIVLVTVVFTAIALGLLVLIRGVLQGSWGMNDESLIEKYQDREHALPSDDLYRKQLKQLEGTVKILGVNIYDEGSHRLERDNKLLVIMESETVSLTDYEGQDVRVRGFVRDTKKGGQKIMEVVYLEPNDFWKDAGLNRFHEQGYEFGFSYPTDWKYKKEANKVTFYQQSGDGLEVNIMIVFQFQEVQEPFDVWLDDRDQNLSYDEVQVKVGSVTGVRRVIKSGNEEIVKTYVTEGNNAYELRLLSQDEVARAAYAALVDQFQTAAGEDDDGMSVETDAKEDDQAVLTQDSDKAEVQLNAESPPAQEQAPSDVSSGLTPLSEDEVSKTMEKGFSPFEGRILSFDYPTIWYFSHLESNVYGFTDHNTYVESGGVISLTNSRIILSESKNGRSCAYSAAKSSSGASFLVCALESGLKPIADRIAESIQKK
ncbi:MAG: hypothetical protein Q8P95_04570 [bacterium]|nr:hypothetical protein [bacterium]